MAKIPDWGDPELKDNPYERNSKGEAFKLFADPQGRAGVWHVYKDGRKVFVWSNPRPDGNVLDAGGGNVLVATSGSPDAQAAANARAADDALIAAETAAASDRAAEEARAIERQREELRQRDEAETREKALAASAGGFGIASQLVPGTTAPASSDSPAGSNTSAPEQKTQNTAVPAAAGGGAAGFPTASSYQNQAVPAAGSVHTVVKGDTMWDIARANNMKLSELVALNPQIKDPHWIYPGDKINLGDKGAASATASGWGGTGGATADPAKVPLNPTTPPPDPFNGSNKQ